MKKSGRRITVSWFQAGGIPLLLLFAVGFLGGLLIGIVGRQFWGEMDFLGENMLMQMKYMTVDSNVFLWYVLGSRIKAFILAVVMTTTYLGLFYVCASTVWYGASGGLFLMIALTRYGLKGILLAVVGVFPQCLLYVPAFYCLMLWCERVCRSIYFEKKQLLSDRQALTHRVLQLVGVLAVVIMGCVLESYVNPILFGGLLKIF